MRQVNRWLPLKRAAALLGVDETTLRHWADAGKVPVYRTPGGHRRFLERDLRALAAPAAPHPPDLAAVLSRQSGHFVTGLPARRLHATGWYAAMSNGLRMQAREHGRRVLEVLGQAVGGKADHRTIAARMAAMGEEYGTVLRASGLTLAQATEAFCFFRDLLLMRMEPATRGNVRVLREVSRLLDHMLVALVAAYEKRGGEPFG